MAARFAAHPWCVGRFVRGLQSGSGGSVGTWREQRRATQLRPQQTMTGLLMGEFAGFASSGC